MPGPVGQGTAQRGGLHLLRRLLRVRPRYGPVHDAAAGELRRPNGALPGPAGALLPVRLLPAAANVAAGLGGVGALPGRGLLRHDYLVDQRHVHLRVKDVRRQVDLDLGAGGLGLGLLRRRLRRGLGSPGPGRLGRRTGFGWLLSRRRRGGAPPSRFGLSLFRVSLFRVSFARVSFARVSLARVRPARLSRCRLGFLRGRGRLYGRLSRRRCRRLLGYLGRGFRFLRAGVRAFRYRAHRAAPASRVLALYW